MYGNQAQNPRAARWRRRVVGALVALTLLALVPATALAGSEERKGTGGALELRLPVGPRGTALGAAGIGRISGVEAMFWNPAGLADIEGTEAMFSHTAYFADMKLNYAAVATTVAGFGTLAFNAKVLSIGDIIVTTEQSPEGTGEILTPTFTVLGASWGRRFTDRVLFGATVNFVNEDVQSVTARGVGFDFGVQYLTDWRGLRFGLSMKNIGPSMEFRGENLNTSHRPDNADPTASPRIFTATSSAFELPSFVSIAASYDAYDDTRQRFALMTAFQSNNFVGDNLCAGAEWTYRDQFALRGSYFGSVRQATDRVSGDETLDFTAGDDLYQGWAVGAGAKVRSGDSMLGVDVTWRGVREFFDDVVEVGLKLLF